MNYKVTWEIDVDADSFEEAAWVARKIQIDTRSIATVFKIEDDEGEMRCLDVGEKYMLYDHRGLEAPGDPETPEQERDSKRREIEEQTFLHSWKKEMLGCLQRLEAVYAECPEDSEDIRDNLRYAIRELKEIWK